MTTDATRDALKAPPATLRIPELDLLRFVAAFSVVLFHYYVLLPDSEPQRIIASIAWLGFLGVPLFFMISGFVIFQTAFNRAPGEFVLARLCRLYPSFWICVLITSAVFALVGHAPPLPRIMANMTMMYHLLGYGALDEVYWTLFVELKFYGLVFILLICMQLARIERWIEIWLGMYAVGLLLALTHHHAIAALEAVDFYGYCSFFALGCYAYLLRTRGGTPRRWLGVTVSVVLSLFAVRQMPGFYFSEVTRSMSLAASLVLLVLSAAMLAIATTRLTLPRPLFWYWLGSLTYPLYLLHAMAGKLLFYSLPASWNVGFRIALSLSAVLIVATVLAVTIEQRGCAALYRWLRNIPGKRAIPRGVPRTPLPPAGAIPR